MSALSMGSSTCVTFTEARTATFACLVGQWTAVIDFSGQLTDVRAMAGREIAQIALVLQRAHREACATIDSRIEEIYRDHSSKGLLQSGATIHAAARAMRETVSAIIPEITKDVQAVVVSEAAFAAMNATFQEILDACKERFDRVVRLADGRRNGAEADGAVVAAADKLFGDWRTDVEGQLAILAHDFDQLAPVLETNPVPPSPSAVRKGGRPPAEFWDDMWAATATALYDGTLNPKTQADVERAMADWIEANGHTAADSTIRARARRLWDRLSITDA